MDAQWSIDFTRRASLALHQKNIFSKTQQNCPGELSEKPKKRPRAMTRHGKKVLGYVKKKISCHPYVWNLYGKINARKYLKPV